MRRDNRALKRFRLELDSLRELVRHGLPEVITDLNIQTGEDTVGDPRNRPAADRDDPAREDRSSASASASARSTQALRRTARGRRVLLHHQDRDGQRASITARFRPPAPSRSAWRRSAIWPPAAGPSLAASSSGLPGQTRAHIEETLELLGELAAGPARASAPSSRASRRPFAGTATGDFEKTIECIARLRLRNPSYVIPAISALNLRGGGRLRPRAERRRQPRHDQPHAADEPRRLPALQAQPLHHARAAGPRRHRAAGCTISTVSIAETMRRRREALPR